MSRPKGRGCPTPDKAGFRTQGRALAAAARIRQDNAQAAAPLPWEPSNAYRCKCGKWHLSTVKP